MSQLVLLQIAYDEASWAQRDPDFLPWDNRENLRPDWRELWSLRALWAHWRPQLQPQDRLGVFSPRLREKTTLTGADVRRILQADTYRDGDAAAAKPGLGPILSFSHHLHHIALFRNVFLQGEHYHPGLLPVMEACLRRLQVPLDLTQPVATFDNTVFSHFFVAPVAVWDPLMAWFDAIYQWAEDPDDPLGAALRAPTPYLRGALPLKVFVVERCLSALLWHTGLRARLVLPVLPWAEHQRIPRPLLNDYLHLEALKARYRDTGLDEYLQAYESHRQALLDRQISLL